jgi:hypothetical protein
MERAPDLEQRKIRAALDHALEAKQLSPDDVEIIRKIRQTYTKADFEKFKVEHRRTWQYLSGMSINNTKVDQLGDRLLDLSMFHVVWP